MHSRTGRKGRCELTGEAAAHVAGRDVKSSFFTSRPAFQILLMYLSMKVMSLLFFAAVFFVNTWRFDHNDCFAVAVINITTVFFTKN